MQSTPLLSLEESNNILIKLINDNKPFTISRVGTETSQVALCILKKRAIPELQLKYLVNNAGIYYSTQKHLETYAKLFNKAVLESNYLACFDPNPSFTPQQEEYLQMMNGRPPLHFKALEPFYCIEEGLIPWTHHLESKRILIISPFVDSFKKQLSSSFQFYSDDSSKQLFKPNQQFVFYKAYSTLGGNHIHSNWYDTFYKMCKDIKEMSNDFDIVLLGCGGYGMPLCDYIKSLGKSAIYIGGGLQLLFGVKGKRWADHEIIKRESSKPTATWIYPSETETIKKAGAIEGGCYWK